MPASPGDGATLAAQILEAVHALEQQLIGYIAGRLRLGITSDRWADDRLAEIRMVQQRLISGVQAATPQILAEVTSIVHSAYTRGQALATIDIEDAGKVLIAPWNSAAAVDSAAQSAIESTRAALQLAPSLLTDAYRQAVQAGGAEVLGGSMTRLQAAQHVLDDLALRGITGYRDTAGRNWALESYIEMGVRTSSAHAAIDAHLATLSASGMDLVIVQEAPRHCPICAPWNRQVLSISGQVGAIIEPSAITGNSVTVQVAGTVEAARSAGWGHPGCRCTLSAYTVGVTKIGDRTPVGNAAGYEASQRQREIERTIRAWKRRQAAALDNESARKAALKVRQWQSVLREHIDANDLQRLRNREQIGRAL